MTGARRHVVGAGDPATLEGLLDRLGEGAGAAVAEGRVFVGRKRASLESVLRVGDVVDVHAPRDAGASLVVLHEDRDLAVLDKPATLPTIPDHRGSASLLTLASARWGDLHATSRLDVGVSGVVVFARTEKARAKLARAREQGRYERRYVAIAVGDGAPPSVVDAPIGRAKDPRLRAVGGRDATSAETHVRQVAVGRGHALLALTPVTGRTHQLRVHLAHVGLPLLGDTAYGGPSRIVDAKGKVTSFSRIALHCARVVVLGRRFSAAVPDGMLDAWTALGGEASAWDDALR